MTFDEALELRIHENPHLAPILQFRRALLEVKEDFFQSLPPPPPPLPEKEREKAFQKGVPLVSLSHLPTEIYPALSPLLLEILVTSKALAPTIQEAATALQKGGRGSPSSPSLQEAEKWVKSFLQGETLSVAMTYAASTYSPFHLSPAPHTCPFCQSSYDLFSERERKAICSLCDTAWTIPELNCPSCHGAPADHTLCATPFPKHKFLLCEDSHTYTRLLNSNSSEPCFSAPRERILFLPYDLAFQKRGYLPAQEVQS